MRTNRLLMRRWRDSDREPYAEMCADPVVMHYFPALQDRATTDAAIERMEQRFDAQGFGLWALERLDSHDFIGWTGLNPMPDGVPGASGMEVGWRLAQRAWHQGFATEAATAALVVGFETAALAEIWSMTSVLNVPSRAVMERLGMLEFGHFDHPAVEPGHRLRAHVVYRIGRPEQVTTPAANGGSR